MPAIHTPRAPRTRVRALVALLLLGAATACSRGSDLPVEIRAPVPGLLALGLAAFPASVVAGGQATIGITIARSGSFTGPVTLAVEGAPTGVTTSLSATVLAAGVTSATLTVQVGANVAAGSYPHTVRASGAGVPDQTAVIALVVTAPPPAPTLTVASSTGSVSVVQNNTSSTAITLTLTTSFVTANGTVGSFIFGPQLIGPDARTVYGVPLSLTQPGDLHAVLMDAVSGTDIVR